VSANRLHPNEDFTMKRYVSPATWLAAATWIVVGGAAAVDARGAGSVGSAARPVATSVPRNGPPPAGRYGGQLCVTPSGASEQCGPVALLFQRGTVRVQVSDLAYHLTWRAPKTPMRMVLMHGSVQVDEFVTEGQWAKQTLRFKDPDKDVHYEVRWETIKP
jgi:hypothetical protein